MHVLEDTGFSPSFLVYPLWLFFILNWKWGYVGHLRIITRIGGWIFKVTGVADISFWGMRSSIGWCFRCGV
jgi:hypothetical protein